MYDFERESNRRKGRVERSWAMDLGGSSEERRGEMEAARQDPNRGNAREYEGQCGQQLCAMVTTLRPGGRSFVEFKK